MIGALVSEIVCKYRENGGTLLSNRIARSELIHLVGAVYEKSTSHQSPLDKKLFQKGLSDGFLKQAEDVLKKAFFSTCPGSQLRLIPLATSYTEQWSQLLEEISGVSLGTRDEDALVSRVRSFVSTHDQFSQQFIEELKTHKASTHMGVELTMPATLTIFYAFTIDFIQTRPELGEQLKKMIEESDPKAFLMIPHLTLLQLIKHQNCPTPELLVKFKSELTALNSLYQELSEEEVQAIEAHLFNDEEALSEKAAELHGKILNMAYRLHEKELAQPFANCFRALLTEINCDLSLAVAIKQDVLSLDLDQSQMSTLGLIYTLLHLSSQSLQQLYPFLTRLRKIEPFQAQFSNSDASFKNEVKEFLLKSRGIVSNPGFMKIYELNNELSQEPKLYRLLAIVQMLK